jgi:hypothetical protein
MTTKQTEGYDFAKGAMRYLTEVLLIGMILIGVLVVLMNTFGLHLDDSDNGGWGRSGLKVHRDAKTGIEYLSDGRGGMVKREEVK